MLFCAKAALDHLLQIAFLTVLHDDVELEVALVNATIVVANDVRVLQVSQDIDLRNDLLFLFIVHLAIV